MRFAQWAAITCLAALQAAGQDGRNEFGVWAGFSPRSPALIGTAPDRQYAIAALRYGRLLLLRRRRVALQYTLDAVPAAVLLQPPDPHGSRSAVYGFGVSPIGFKLAFRPRSRLQPFLSTSGGLVYSFQPVPIDIPGATQFNFTFHFGAGVEYFTSPHWSFAAGYRLDHISNAYRTDVNPGVDANVLFAGFSFWK